MLPLVTVVTATIGRPELLNCINSVAIQSHQNIQHLIIVDGEEHRAKVDAVLKQVSPEYLRHIDLVYLPYPRKGWGGPIYSIGPSISKGDFIANLDDDNTFDFNHIESCLYTLNTRQVDWVFSLRKITRNGKFVFNDNCESLGCLHPVWNTSSRHIDTSAYFLPREIALKMAPHWNPEGGSSIYNDRVFYHVLQNSFPNYVCTGQYTLNYEVSPAGKIDINFFIRGNLWMQDTYQTETPWLPVRTAIVSFYGSKSNLEMVSLQKRVFEKFRGTYSFHQIVADIKADYEHGENLDKFIRQNLFNYDVFLIFDIDCIPLKANVIPFMIDIASRDILIGCAQRANHIQNDAHIYAGPFCMGFSANTYRKIGFPSFKPTARGDTGEELTYKCQEHGIEVQVIWPSHVEVPKWDLVGDLKFGIGTTYDNAIFHQFESRYNNGQLFIDKCRTLLGS